MEIDTAAFINIYGKRNEATKRIIRMKRLDSYSTLFVRLQGDWNNAYVQLLSGADKVVKTIKVENGHADFYFLNPGTYYLRLFRDRNGNGVWDTGDYDQHIQPEPVYYFGSTEDTKNHQAEARQGKDHQEPKCHKAKEITFT